MSTGTAIVAALVILAMVGLGVLATRINRRSSEGTTPQDQRRPLNQTGSVFQETGESDRERHHDSSQHRFPSGRGGGGS